MRLVLSALTALLASAATAQPADPMEAERAPDLRLATLADRLATAALTRCADRQGRTGLVLHTLDQYDPVMRDRVATGFGLGMQPAVIALVPGSPAERAGVGLDDTILSADGEPMPTAHAGPGTFETAAAAADLLDQATANGELTLALRSREGVGRTVTFTTPPTCRVRPVLTGEREERASTDGVYLKASLPLLAVLPDDQLAAALAHEFAHILLRHPQRLRLAGTRRIADVRRTEAEADRLSVALLADAGFDPTAAVRLWQGWGRGGNGLFGDTSHGGSKVRIAAISAAIAALPPPSAIPISAVKETTNGE